MEMLTVVRLEMQPLICRFHLPSQPVTPLFYVAH